MEIKFQENDKQINIFINYKLKDLFKSHFKTAKWNSLSKSWYIANTTANKNKLDKFIDEVNSSNLNKTIDELEEIEFNENELSRLKNEIDDLENELKNKLKQFDNINTLKESISLKIEQAKKFNEQLLQAKEAIEKASLELENEKQKFQDTISANREIISRAIDIDRVEILINGLDKLSSKARTSFLYAKEKDQFHSYQRELREINGKLESVGFTSSILKDIINANVNRLDRDKVCYGIDNIIKTLEPIEAAE